MNVNRFTENNNFTESNLPKLERIKLWMDYADEDFDAAFYLSSGGSKFNNRITLLLKET